MKSFLTTLALVCVLSLTGCWNAIGIATTDDVKTTNNRLDEQGDTINGLKSDIESANAASQMAVQKADQASTDHAKILAELAKAATTHPTVPSTSVSPVTDPAGSTPTSSPATPPTTSSELSDVKKRLENIEKERKKEVAAKKAAEKKQQAEAAKKAQKDEIDKAIKQAVEPLEQQVKDRDAIIEQLSDTANRAMVTNLKQAVDNYLRFMCQGREFEVKPIWPSDKIRKESRKMQLPSNFWVGKQAVDLFVHEESNTCYMKIPKGRWSKEAGKLEADPNNPIIPTPSKPKKEKKEAEDGDKKKSSGEAPKKACVAFKGPEPRPSSSGHAAYIQKQYTGSGW